MWSFHAGILNDYKAYKNIKSIQVMMSCSRQSTFSHMFVPPRVTRSDWDDSSGYTAAPEPHPTPSPHHLHLIPLTSTTVTASLLPYVFCTTHKFAHYKQTFLWTSCIDKFVCLLLYISNNPHVSLGLYASPVFLLLLHNFLTWRFTKSCTQSCVDRVC